MKLYRLAFASYDGCNGWTHWYGDEVYTDKDKAQLEAMKRNSSITRCGVAEFDTIN
jgi:hypothetical protein